MFLDLTLGIATLITLFITHYKVPKVPDEVKPIHQIEINCWVLFHILWGTGISIVESSTANSVPTLLVGIFSAATMFLVRGYIFLIYLIISFLALLFGLYFLNHMSMDQLVKQYSTIVVLYALALIISRILLNTRIKSFSENKDLEIAKNNLDKTIRQRTVELSKTNKTLREEIRERKHYAISLEEEKKKAEEADRLKSVFLANMSHEIRTPLNGILGFGDLLQNQDLSESKKSKYLDIIHNNGQRLLNLIDDIMDISMIESNQLKVNKVNFRLSQIFPDAFVFFENYKHIEEKGHLKIINEGFSENGNDHVNLDPSRVQQVLYNLLSNAIKFTNEGTIRFGGKYDNAYALIYVEDSGIGIDSEKCQTIFQRFRQGEESISRKYGGTGIGLSISKGIIELLEGMIWVDLSYTKGTRMCFSLPTEEITESDSSKTSQANIDLLDKKTVVITEENETTMGALTPILKSTMSKCSYISLENYNPKTLEAKPELVIMDIPKNKSELLHCIQNTLGTFQDCNIVVITDKNTLSDKDPIKAGCSLVMDTPVNFQVFLLYLYGLFG